MLSRSMTAQSLFRNSQPVLTGMACHHLQTCSMHSRPAASSARARTSIPGLRSLQSERVLHSKIAGTSLHRASRAVRRRACVHTRAKENDVDIADRVARL